MSSHLRGLPALMAVIFAGCASPGPGDIPVSAPAQAPGSITPTGTGIDIRLASDRQTVVAVVEATQVDAWNALVDVYQEARIPVTEQDLSSGVVGNPRFVTRGRLLGRPLSYFLDCGQGLTGAHADNDRIVMSIRSSVAAAEQGRVRLSVLVDAVARPTEGTSTGPIQCGSSQRLENEILRRVSERLATVGS